MPAFWDTPHRPMITHTSDSHQIPSQNKTKSKFQILKNSKFCKKLYMRHTFLSCLMYKYEMDPIRTVGATEQTRDAGQTDEVKPIYPPTTSLCIISQFGWIYQPSSGLSGASNMSASILPRAVVKYAVHSLWVEGGKVLSGHERRARTRDISCQHLGQWLTWRRGLHHLRKGQTTCTES